MRQPPPAEARRPIEIWHEMRDLLAASEADAHKSSRGMRAGGARLR